MSSSFRHGRLASSAMIVAMVLLIHIYVTAAFTSTPGSEMSDPNATIQEGEEDSCSPEALVGPTLMAWSSRANREAIIDSTGNVLKNASYLGIFFSASYCGPCKQFIPLLEQFYNKMKQKGKSFEIIWVNSDTQASKNDFLEYYRLMPWPAVPFEVATDALMRTAHRYSLSGIPHLVIVHGDDCSVITLDGRMKVVEDPNGLEFPWGNRARSLIPVPRFVEKYIARKVKALRLSILSAIQPRALLYAVQSVALGVLRLVGAIASKLGSMFFA